MDVSEMTRKEARAFFNEYMARREPALAGFREKLAGFSGLPVETFDYSVESLQPLWTHLWPQLRYPKEEQSSDQSPFWYKHLFQFSPFRSPQDRGKFWLEPEIAELVEGFAYYLGEVYIRNIPGCQWDFGKRSKRDFIYHRPYITGPYHAGMGLDRVLVFMGNAIDTPEHNSRGCSS